MSAVGKYMGKENTKLNKRFCFSVDSCWNNNLPGTTGQRLGRGSERSGGVLDSARGWQAVGHGSRCRKRQGERGRRRRVLRDQSTPPGSGHREPQPGLWAYAALSRHRSGHCEYNMYLLYVYLDILLNTHHNSVTTIFIVG